LENHVLENKMEDSIQHVIFGCLNQFGDTVFYMFSCLNQIGDTVFYMFSCLNQIGDTVKFFQVTTLVVYSEPVLLLCGLNSFN